MRLILNKNHDLKSDESLIGYSQENLSENINIAVMDSALYDKWAFLEFQVNDGDTYVTPRLEVDNGMINYPLPNGLLYETGTLKVQVVFRYENDWVWKSSIKKFNIEKSINADDELVKQYPDFIAEE